MTSLILSPVSRGPWLCRSWQSGHFQHQRRSTVQVPKLAAKYFEFFICELQFRKDENKEKDAGIGPLKESLVQTVPY